MGGINMPEDQKISHLMKGVAEDLYHVLISSEVSTVDKFVKCCCEVDAIRKKRVVPLRYERGTTDQKSRVRQERKKEKHQRMIRSGYIRGVRESEGRDCDLEGAVEFVLRESGCEAPPAKRLNIEGALVRSLPRKPKETVKSAESGLEKTGNGLSPEQREEYHSPRKLCEVITIYTSKSTTNEEDLSDLIRRIVKEKIKKVLSQIVTCINDGSSDLESIIREEVRGNLTPLNREKPTPSPYRTKKTGESSWRPRTRPRQENRPTEQDTGRKTDI
ncbi:CCHC-type domain-containing protein [Trichonephila clavipes]|nr:CCHC-type domain-containing protein [Trichonephila clavipes]